MNKNHTCIEIRNLERIAVKLLNSNQEWKNKNITLAPIFSMLNKIPNLIKQQVDGLNKFMNSFESTIKHFEKVLIEMRETFKKKKKRNKYQIDLAEYLLGCYALKLEERDLNYAIISNLSNFFHVFKKNINKNFGELYKLK